MKSPAKKSSATSTELKQAYKTIHALRYKISFLEEQLSELRRAVVPKENVELLDKSILLQIINNFPTIKLTKK